MAAIGNGSLAALGELYDRVGGSAYRLALAVVRDGRLAEDVVHDAFLTVWRTAGGDSAGPVAGWLLNLVYGRALEEQKRGPDSPRPVEYLHEVATAPPSA